MTAGTLTRSPWSPRRHGMRSAPPERSTSRPQRGDGSPSRTATIWLLRAEDESYMRSFRGSAGGWYRAATRTKQGRVTVAGNGYDVTFTSGTDTDRHKVDAAY